MIPLLVLHLLVAIAVAVPGHRASRWALWIAALAPAATFIWLVMQSSAVLHGDEPAAYVQWVPQLGLSISLKLDGFGLLMGLLVSGIGFGVLLYSVAYFGRRPDLYKLAALLVGFAGAMLGLVWADGLFTLFLFWELTSITSFLLIGFEDGSATARSAAVRAFLVTGAGGLVLLAGLILIGQAAGTSSISEILAEPPSGTVVSVALVLVLIGAFTKSAQFPFHFWLPGAMAAPTPVSAYLHSATMVKAGLVVVARFAPVFADVGIWRPLILAAGLASLVLGGVRAMRQQDAKLALAHGTVSQLGFMMVLLGLGTPGTTYAGVAMLLAHALFKAALFLSVGVIDHSAGTRDMRRLQGLLGKLPVVAATVIVASASMAAIPPTFGFVAKEKALAALTESGLGATGTVALIGVVCGSILTVAYTMRIAVGLLGNDAPGDPDADGPASIPTPVEAIHAPTPAFLSAPALLGLLSLGFGLAAEPVGHWVAEVSASLDPASGAEELHLWGGFNHAVMLTGVILVGGALLWWATRVGTRLVDARRSAATVAYDRGYNGLLEGARRITAVTQSGSLPFYLGVVLTTLAIGVGVSVGVDGISGFRDTPILDSPLELAAAVLTIPLALSVVLARQRFTAAVLLGGSGYMLALLYLLQGAPDLAITQFLVETLTIVVFLLALARLPSEFNPPPSWVPRTARVAFALTVGIVVALFALSASQSRTEPSVGEEYMQRSYEEAGGRNVVNVILVDFRGFDTLGEITVLAVAGIGVVNLVGAARRQQRRKDLADGTDIEDRSGRDEKVWR